MFFKTPLSLFITLVALFYLNTSHAQIANDYSALLEQADSTQRADFLSMLENMDVDLVDLNDSLNNSGVQTGLYDLLQGQNPIMNLDSLIEEWSVGRGLLLNGLTDMGTDPLEIDSVLVTFDNINDTWNENVVDLSTIFDEYSDDINNANDPSNPLGVTVTDPTSAGLDSLELDLENALENTDINPGGFSDVIGQLFNENLFTQFEIAYGRKAVNVNYYSSNYSLTMEDLQVLRIGTVPTFASDWEARWHMSGSWSGEEVGPISNSEIVSQAENESIVNPLTIDCDFAFMYNPKIVWFNGGDGQMVTVRLITSLGVEVSTYVPDHINPDIPFTLDNEGFTTSCGPQLGTGFSVATGPITAYTLGTIAHGVVGNGPYNYTSMNFTAGVRFGNAINIRYSMGHQDWAPDQNKRVNTLQQFTVGVILDELFN